MKSKLEFPAEDFIDGLLQEKNEKHLSDAEKTVLRGSLDDLTYEDMAKDCNYSVGYLKEIGKKLWDRLSELLGERVSKTNFQEALKRKRKEQSPQRQHDFEVNCQILENTYIERIHIESTCYETISQPGSLIRIKAPQKMEKNWLTNRILERGKKHEYQTAYIDLLDADTFDFQDSDKFLWWFCSGVSRELNVPKENLHEYWDEEDSSQVNCKIYFEECLLPKVTEALVLYIDNIDLVFPQHLVAENFLGLLRSWHETAKRKILWKKLRLVVVHSTEVCIRLDINKSPFNVGVSIELKDFDSEQVDRLTEIYNLSWQAEKVQSLTDLVAVAGHPFLLNTALSYVINHQDLTLSELLEEALTNPRSYSSYLQNLLSTSEDNSELKVAFEKVFMTREFLNSESLLSCVMIMLTYNLLLLDKRQYYHNDT